MEFRQLRHFIVLAEEKHFGRAAKRLFITQSALSTSIQRLEGEFGVRLFERDSKGVRVTLAGQLMLDRAREILNHTDRAKKFSIALSEGRLGRLEVGFTSTVIHQNLDRVVQDFRAEFPEIEIVMREAVSLHQIELLRSGRLDAGLISLPAIPAGLSHIELYEDDFVICLPSGHPLAKRKAIDIADLRDESFVLPSTEIAPQVYDQLVDLCNTAGFHPQVAFESLHELNTVFLVSRGHGIGFVMRSLVNVAIQGAVFVPINRQVQVRRGHFVWNPNRLTPGLQVLIDGFRSYAAQGNRPVSTKPKRRSS